MDSACCSKLLFNGEINGYFGKERLGCRTVWFTPYKMIEFLGKGLELPRAVVYNIKELPQEQFEYNENCMMSVEV